MSVRSLTHRLKIRRFCSPEVADEAVAAYADWRNECISVCVAYSRWSAAGPSHEPVEFSLYNAALDGEEQAARRYAELAVRVERTTPLGVARRLAPLVSRGEAPDARRAAG